MGKGGGASTLGNLNRKKFLGLLCKTYLVDHISEKNQILKITCTTKLNIRLGNFHVSPFKTVFHSI